MAFHIKYLPYCILVLLYTAIVTHKAFVLVLERRLSSLLCLAVPYLTLPYRALLFCVC